MPDDYRELPPPPAARGMIACLWISAGPARIQTVVPDGCVDLIRSRADGLVVHGADTGPRRVELPAAALIEGVRLRPGAAGAALGLPASELRDRRIPLVDLWGARGRELEAVMVAAGPNQRLAAMAAALAGPGAQPDPLVVAAAHRLAAVPIRVRDVAHELGVSERQLHRRTLAAVGYGPKMLGRVARLRRLVAADPLPLAARALAAGYAGQSHMADEVRRLTGATPVRFLEDAVLTAA